MIIFQFVLNELFSQLSALVSLNLSRGSVLVSLNLPGQKCHGALPRVISHPVHAEQPTVPCGITLTQTNWKISPLSEQNAFKKKKQNRIPEIVCQAVQVCCYETRAQAKRINLFAPWIRIFSMSVRSINQGVQNLLITPYLSLYINALLSIPKSLFTFYKQTKKRLIVHILIHPGMDHRQL